MKLETELVPEHTEHPGQPEYWIAYRVRVAALGSLEDRIRCALARGATEQQALDRAALRLGSDDNDDIPSSG